MWVRHSEGEWDSKAQKLFELLDLFSDLQPIWYTNEGNDKCIHKSEGTELGFCDHFYYILKSHNSSGYEAPQLLGTSRELTLREYDLPKGVFTGI